MNEPLVVALLVSGLAYGTPLLLAALGELLAETSGVMNLGIEGMMLVGAFAAFAASQHLSGGSGVVLVGAVTAGAVAAALLALVHAFATVSLRASQIVMGLALTIFGAGFTTYLGYATGLTGQAGKHAFSDINIPLLQDIPYLGPGLFRSNALVYASWAAAALVALYLRRTRLGLNARAVGNDPAAADAMGISVERYRYAHVIAGGAFAGIAGSFYTLSIAPRWNDGLTAGAGWIALALVIFSFWRPGLLVVGAILFGVVSSLGFTLQARGITSLPPELFSALPYLLTAAALCAMSSVVRRQRIGAPSALGTPYVREEG
jgi:simple sugar transport system permease protein